LFLRLFDRVRRGCGVSVRLGLGVRSRIRTVIRLRLRLRLRLVFGLWVRFRFLWAVVRCGLRFRFRLRLVGIVTGRISRRRVGRVCRVRCRFIGRGVRGRWGRVVGPGPGLGGRVRDRSWCGVSVGIGVRLLLILGVRFGLRLVVRGWRFVAGRIGRARFGGVCGIRLRLWVSIGRRIGRGRVVGRWVRRCGVWFRFRVGLRGLGLFDDDVEGGFVVGVAGD
jgi:hypothetical protein